MPGRVYVHQVEIETPGETQVLTGVLGFPSDDRFELHAQTPVGLDVFTLEFDGSQYSATVVPALEGRIPVEEMARDIWSIYRNGCALPPHAPAQDSATITLRCRWDEDVVTEVLTSGQLLVASREVVTKTGRKVDVSYQDYRRYDGVEHPRRITLSSGPLLVRIVLASIAPMVTTAAP